MKNFIRNTFGTASVIFLGIFCLSSPALAQLDAALFDDNIPTEMHPGETRRLSVTMQNSGGDPWAGDDFRLASQNTPGDLWSYQAFLLDPAETINPGGQKVFTFYLKAPDIGNTYDSSWQMKQESTGTFFGENFIDSIFVDDSVVPEWDSMIISDTLPTELYPGEPRLVEIVFENTGDGDWSGNRYALSSRQNTPEDLWDTILYNMLGDTETIAPTEQKTFTFIITAPSVDATYDCNWQMLNIGPDNVHFGELLSEPVTVNTSVIPQLGNTLTGNTIPTDMFPGEARSATITFENTGTVTWDDTNVRLYAPTPTWGSNRIYTLGSVETVAQGGSKTFTVVLIAPGSEGTYDCDWTMQGVWDWGEGNQFAVFGDEVSEPVNVDSGVTAFLNASVESHTIPAAMSPGQVLSVDVTMRNTGSATWDGSDSNWIRLRTQNSPGNLWGPSNIDLDPSDSIAPDETKTFTFDITAPAAPGSYQCRWQLQKHWPNPNTFLGELLDVGVQVGAVPEICDDGLDNDGDSDIDCADPDCNGELCDDDDACTTGETCSGVVCGGGLAVDCDDANICTNDTCDSVNGCEYTNNADPCDDGLFCNGDDTCAGGSCTHAGDPCTLPDVCDEDNDLCGSPIEICDDGIDNDGDSDIDCADADCDAEPCDDGFDCTESDVCSGGTCDGTPNDLLCDDTNDCTDEVCTAGVGCEYTNNADPCDDGVDCTEGDTCDSGSCNGTPNDANCTDDGLYCNGDEFCDGVLDCTSTGDPCPGGTDCNESTDQCDVTTTTTTSSPPTTTIPVPTCVVTITPDDEAVESGDTVAFSAITTCNQVQVAGSYTWEIIPASSIGSDIDEGTGLYTAGDNDTASDVTDSIRVSDTTNNVTDTAPVVVLSEIPTECTVVLEPASPTVNSGDTITFEATTAGEGCLEPDYEWSIDSDINSTINPGGSTCLYQAGTNSTAMLQEDTITVYDSANDTTVEAAVTVSYGGIVAVFPRTLLSSRWLPLPRVMYIIGSNTVFNRTSQPSFTPDDDITTIGKIGFGRFLIVWVLVSRQAEEGLIDVAVTTTNSEGQEVTFTQEDATRISPLPFMLDQRKFGFREQGAGNRVK